MRELQIVILQNLPCAFFHRYTGHKHSQYKIDSCLNDEDTLIVSGSEDGKVYFWDLVTVSLLNCSTFCDQTWHGIYDLKPVLYEKNWVAVI